MPNQEEMLLAELAIEKYADAKGLDVKTVKAKWLPILQATKDKDPFTESLTNACAVLGQIKDISKGLDPETQTMLGKLATVAVTRTMDGKDKEDDTGDEALINTIKRLKILDHAFEDEGKLVEEVAAKVNEQVAQPLSEALGKLNITLEKVSEKVSGQPEQYQGDSDVAELSRTMENINSKLAELAEKVERGPVSKEEVSDDVDKMVDRLNEATEKSKEFLEKRGFKIVTGETPASLEEAKKLVEASGYTLQDRRITREDAEKLAQERVEGERKKHNDEMELKLEEKKIDAAKEIVGTAIDKVMEPFKYFIDRYLQGALGETQLPPAPVPPGTQTVAEQTAATEITQPTEKSTARKTNARKR